MKKQTSENNDKGYKKRYWAVPDAFIIIFGISVLAAIATYIIPAGMYEREEVDGITQAIPNSFSFVESSPTSLMDLFLAVQKGMIESGNIIFLIFMIGGTVAVLESTGAIDAGINSLIRKANGNKTLLIAVVSTIFGIICTVGVASNAVIAFIPIGIGLARAMKLDAIAGVAIIYLGYFVGNTAGVLEPTILGVAQSISELPLFSGLLLRLAVFIALLIVTIIYICRYVNKISKDPSRSLMKANPFMDNPGAEVEEENRSDAFTKKHMVIILIFFIFIGIFLYGALNLEWSIDELSAIFIMMGITVAIVDKITPNEFMRKFMNGARSITYGALVVGIARAVIVVMEDGRILDTIVHGALIPLESLPVILGAQALYVFNLLFNLLVTSGSGQASIVMPLMVPLVDMLDITRQTGVLALKLGDGITNVITPTSGVLMAVLAVGKVPWTKWVRFVYPLVLLWIAVGAIFMGIAVMINYGPF
ncbi:YfcC family protein [Oceanobacillus timonensis]|uniref:YfcC family protein n=1 Tax=Oceanobacillus timonensis TaxID=1926285 RepID=UPI0009BAA886|nr:AbgT family transporter [Oceanobacillus timonensis]